MFGNSEDIRKETKNEIENGHCYGGFRGRFSYERFKSKKRTARLAEIVRKIAILLVSCIFFGSLGVLAGMMIFSVMQGDFIGFGAMEQGDLESGAKNEANLNITDSMTQHSFISDGAEMVSVTKEYSERYRIPMGVLVKELPVESIGYAAGIREGDIIVMIDGIAVLGKEELSKATEEHREGDGVLVRIFRDGKHRDLNVVME